MGTSRRNHMHRRQHAVNWLDQPIGDEWTAIVALAVVLWFLFLGSR